MLKCSSHSCTRQSRLRSPVVPRANEAPQSKEPLLHHVRVAVDVVPAAAGARRGSVDHCPAVLIPAPFPPEPPNQCLLYVKTIINKQRRAGIISHNAAGMTAKKRF